MASRTDQVNNQYSRQTYSSIEYWLDYCLRHKPIYVVGILTILGCNILQVFTTRAMGWILDFFTDGKIPKIFIGDTRLDTFYILFGALLGGKFILMLVRWGWRVTLARQTHFAAYEMRLGIWDRVRFLPEKMLQEVFTKGAILNLASSDVGMARFLFGFILVGAVDLLFLGILSLFSMWLIDPFTTAVTLIVLAPLPFFIKRLADKEITLYREVQDYLGDFNEMGAQAVATIKLQRLTQSGEYWRKQLDHFAAQYRLKRWSAVKTSMRFTPLMGAASLAAYVVLFWVGIERVIQGHISVGDFVGLQGLTFLLQEPLMNIGFVISDWRKGMASLDRILELYHSKGESHLLQDGGPLQLNRDAPVIETQGLSLYGNLDRVLFENVELKIKAGAKIGLIGPVGSGKSSFVNVLSGLRRDYSGKILFFGVPLEEWGHAQLRRQISVVHQRPFLFAMSIRDNVCLGQQYDEREIWHILEICGIDKEIMNLPHGLDTFLGEWGINLSGGQKQRLTIARALIQRPKILFLDDCLSAVDTVTEEHILSSLNKHLEDMTVIWVAHRASTLRHCDEILEFPYVGAN